MPIVKAVLSHLTRTAKTVTRLSDPYLSHKIILPGRFKRVYVAEDQGVPFLGGKQLLELDPAGKRYLSFAYHEKNLKNQLILRANMILITRSGTIGKLNIVPEHWQGWACSEDIIRVIPAHQDIAGYLYAWLSSDYAHPLITRFTYGAVVSHIEPEQLSSVAVPLLKDSSTQQVINELVLDANQRRFEAYLLEKKAIKLLEAQVIAPSSLSIPLVSG